MLRFEKIDLIKDGFTEEELGELKGGATVKLDGTPVASGEFRLIADGASTMVSIAASGKLANDTAASAVNTLSVSLTQKITRTLNVAAGENPKIQTDFTLVNVALKDAKDTTVTAVAVDTDPTKIACTAAAAVAGPLEVELTVVRGSGVAVDEDVMDNILIDKGELHINALARGIDAPDLKPRTTNMSVRGTNIHF